MRIFPFVLLASLAFATTASVADVTIDFEGLGSMPNSAGSAVPNDARLSDQYRASTGITFSSGSAFVAVVDLGAQTTSGTLGIGGSTATGLLTYDAADPIDFRFSVPANLAIAAGTDSFSVRGDMAPTGGPATLLAYDVMGNLLGSQTLPDTGGITFTLTSTTKNIHLVRFVGSGSIALDDVSFNSVQAVPEPAVFAAFGVGALAMVRRRRKA